MTLGRQQCLSGDRCATLETLRAMNQALHTFQPAPTPESALLALRAAFTPEQYHQLYTNQGMPFESLPADDAVPAHTENASGGEARGGRRGEKGNSACNVHRLPTLNKRTIRSQVRSRSGLEPRPGAEIASRRSGRQRRTRLPECVELCAEHASQPRNLPSHLSDNEPGSHHSKTVGRV